MSQVAHRWPSLLLQLHLLCAAAAAAATTTTITPKLPADLREWRYGWNASLADPQRFWDASLLQRAMATVHYEQLRPLLHKLHSGLPITGPPGAPPGPSPLPPAACRLPPAACRLPPAACRLPPAACRLLPAPRPLLPARPAR
jgi:hypothetical protein